MSTTITHDEWRKALGDAATPCDDGALTIAEMAEMFGIGRVTAYRRVQELIAAGKAVPTSKRVIGRSGFAKRLPAYRLVTAAPPSSAAKRARR